MERTIHHLAATLITLIVVIGTIQLLAPSWFDTLPPGLGLGSL